MSDRRPLHPIVPPAPADDRRRPTAIRAVRERDPLFAGWGPKL